MRNRYETKPDKRLYIAIAIVVILVITFIILVVCNSILEKGNLDIYGENNSQSEKNNEDSENSSDINTEPTQDNENQNSDNNVDAVTNEKTFKEYGVTFDTVNESVYTTIILNLRAKPNFDGEVVTSAALDTLLTRLGIGDNGWDKVKTEDGKILYAYSEYLTTKSAKSGSNGEGLSIAESTGTSTSNTEVDTKHYTSNTLKDGVSEKQADSFFSDTVFYGDSVTLGFQNYVAKQNNDFLGGMIVYGMGSYGIGNALKAISSTSIHPTYKGYQTQLWNLTYELKVKKVFMMFGMNDIGLYGVTDSITNYKTLIDKIREVNPGVEIYILTTTPMTESYQLTYLNNSNIRLFNNTLREKAKAWNVEIIDVASYLMDDNGYLKSEYASDGKYHLTEKAYIEWVKVLRSFASNKI